MRSVGGEMMGQKVLRRQRGVKVGSQGHPEHLSQPSQKKLWSQVSEAGETGGKGRGARGRQGV